MFSRFWRFIREALRDDFSGPHGHELLKAQKELILSRTIILIWISVFVMPTTIWAYVYFAKPDRLTDAIAVVLAAIAAVFLIRALLKRGVFDVHYHLAMVVLVGGVFGPTGTAIVELTHGSGGDFFFAFFLIYFAFTSLFPASAKWIGITSACVVGSWVCGRFFRPEGFVADQRFYENMLYFFQLSFIGLVLNRVIVRLFLSERRATIELRIARDALMDEMKVAQQIQSLLLPKAPRVEGHDVYGITLPAHDVGGDYYDVLHTKTGRCIIAIGDVSGHGVTAGVTMMMARSTLVATLEVDPHVSIIDLFIAVNRSLSENLHRMDLSLYMTFSLYEYFGEGKYRTIGAHLPALVYRASKRVVDEIASPGVWLGVVDDVDPAYLPETDLQLDPGDVLLLYTDGVVERRGKGGMFGFDRLSEMLARSAEANDSKQIVDLIIAELKEYSPEQDDDVTLFALHYQAVPDRVDTKARPN